MKKQIICQLEGLANIKNLKIKPQWGFGRIRDSNLGPYLASGMYCNFCTLFKIKKFLQILWPFGFCFGCLNKVYRNSNTFFKTQTVIMTVRIQSQTSETAVLEYSSTDCRVCIESARGENFLQIGPHETWHRFPIGFFIKKCLLLYCKIVFWANTRPNHRFYMTILFQKTLFGM